MTFDRRLPALLLALPLLLAAGPAPAQEALAPDLPEVEIARGEADLRDRLMRPADPDVLDTALLFNNTGKRGAAVRCVGFDHDGQPVGRVALRVPGLGLRFVLGSDLANGRDFLGSVQCASEGRVLGSAVLLAPGGLSDLPARQGDGVGSIRIRFPVVGAY